MIHRKTFKLRMPMRDAAYYVPRPGIDVIWLDWNHENKTVVAEFVTSDKMIPTYLRNTKKDINEEIDNLIGPHSQFGKNRRLEVLSENFQHQASPRWALRWNTHLDSPEMKKEPDLQRNAKDHVNIPMSDQQLNQLNKYRESQGQKALQPKIQEQIHYQALKKEIQARKPHSSFATGNVHRILASMDVEHRELQRKGVVTANYLTMVEVERA